VLLVELYRNGPLAAAGAKGARQEVILGNQRLFVGGDILARLDDTPITSLEDLQILLETNYQVGDPVTVTLLRNERAMQIKLTLTEEPTR